MFKILFYRDLLNVDPKERRKIKGIVFKIGRRCISSCWCNKANRCRYNRGNKINNAIIRFRKQLYWKFGIKVPQWIFISPYDVDLSGTTKCPNCKSRRYTCWDCKNAYGMENCRIPWTQRVKYEDAEWPNSRCGSYEPNEFADVWNRKTGERIYD